MRKAAIKIEEQVAGWLTQDDRGYLFVYDKRYASQPGARPVSLTLPLQEAAFESNVLFPFFDGLIPEGWLLDIAEKKLEAQSSRSHGIALGLL